MKNDLINNKIQEIFAQFSFLFLTIMHSKEYDTERQQYRFIPMFGPEIRERQKDSYTFFKKILMTNASSYIFDNEEGDTFERSSPNLLSHLVVSEALMIKIWESYSHYGLNLPVKALQNCVQNLNYLEEQDKIFTTRLASEEAAAAKDEPGPSKLRTSSRMDAIHRNSFMPDLS